MSYIFIEKINNQAATRQLDTPPLPRAEAYVRAKSCQGSKLSLLKIFHVRVCRFPAI